MTHTQWISIRKMASCQKLKNVCFKTIKIFSEETAGFSDHHAASFRSEQSGPSLKHNRSISPITLNEIEESEILIDKTGVTDPERAQLSGRSFTVPALKNLASNIHIDAQSDTTERNRPDLVIHNGSAPISEYNNPDLLPGMFPTLFRFGIGGFKDKSRPTALSFKEQAAYYFDIPDRSFRYHFAYMFVALNMVRRQITHLHTYFSTKRSNFDSVARQLLEIAPKRYSILQTILKKKRKFRII